LHFYPACAIIFHKIIIIKGKNMSPEKKQPQPTDSELITGVPKELGGDQIREEAEAKIAADAAAREENPLGAGFTVIHSKLPPQAHPGHRGEPLK
jgi:hypothetical protein